MNEAKKEKEEEPVKIDFSCKICGLSEKCDYFGRKPPFVRKQLEFQDDFFVMRDPFSPIEKKASMMILGTKCSVCSDSVCVECSIFYAKSFCTKCSSEKIEYFPEEVQTKIRRKIKP